MNKMLDEISRRQNESQIIITTHSNLIASRLNLKYVHWITDNAVVSLKNAFASNSDTGDFFVKADNNNFLQLLLSKKVILVEGASEVLLLPKIYTMVTQRSMEADEVSVISCCGITYKRYLEVANDAGKRIAVLTDNDKDQDKIAEATTFNLSTNSRKIFMSSCVNDWTWEVCLYNLNPDFYADEISVKANKKYLYNGNDYGQVLGKMLNNKVEIAYILASAGTAFEIPQYVKDAIEWLNE
jgi:predicted ATP-dependent endonuclease of OLD family